MTTTDATPATQATPAAAEPTRRDGAGRRLLRKPLGVFALVTLGSLVLLAVLAPVLSTHDPNFASLDATNAPPGTEGYPLGADQFGRDIWARVLVSIQVSLISGAIGAGVAVVLGTVFGLIAGYTGRRTDAAMSWTFNLMMSFPALILVMVLSPITGDSYQIMMAIFGVFLSPGIFRLVRNLVAGVRNELYVDAARVAGLSNRRILSRHVLYVVRGPIIITASFLATAAIGVQAGLAFLGIGSTQVASFGSMTNAAFVNIYLHPVQFVWPSLFLALLSGGLVGLGNAYRDALAEPEGAPKKARGRGPFRRRAVDTAVMPSDTAPSQTGTDVGTTEAGTPEVAGPGTSGPPDAATSSTAATASASRDAERAPAGELLSVRNLRVQYPQADGSTRSVVDGVSLDVQPGEIVGLVGESGSGKTQTAFSILGLLPAEAQVDADALTLVGESLQGRSARDLRRYRGSVMSYIPQEPMSNLDPTFTIGSQLVEGLLPAMSKREARATVMELLDRVGIHDPARVFASYPHQISGGMAQRVLIAGAVAPRPKLLIADEPTTALDVTVQAEILDLLRSLQGELGMGVLLVTHNFGVVADLCDRVLVMRTGNLVESGDVRSIFRTPQHPYTQELISAILDEDTVRTDPPASTPLIGSREARS